MTIYKSKICGKCKIDKPLEEFNKDKKRKKGVRSKCKDCGKAATKAWCETYPEKAKAANEKWTAANPEKIRALSKAYRKAHSKKIKADYKLYYEANKEKRKLYNAAWAKANPAKVAEYAALAKAKRFKRVPAWLTKEQNKEITAIFALRDKLQLLYGIKLQVDHIVPLIGKDVSGLHVPGNLQIITARENLSKGNKFDPYTFVHEF